MEHLKAEKPQKEICEFLGVKREAVRRWRVRFSKGGVERLQSERQGGRVIWKEIQKLLKEKYEVDYSQKGIYGLLKRLRLVWISVRSKHPKSDPVCGRLLKKLL